MTKEEAEYLSVKIREEEFHYCFKHYSRFGDIKDEKFHELRTAYLKSADELEKYINEQLIEGEDE